MTRLITVLASLFLVNPTLAHERVAGDLVIVHPYIPQPAASAKTAGGYMAIINNGTQADRLIGIESDIAAKAQVHESKVDANGLGTMDHVDAIDIPAGGTVSLEHGGYHIMFMGLTGPLTEGELHKGVLIFEKAGRVEIEFMVDPPVGKGGGNDATDHSKMGHGGSGG